MKVKSRCPECGALVHRGGEIHYGNRWHKTCWEKAKKRHSPFGVNLTSRQAKIRTKKYRASHIGGE